MFSSSKLPAKGLLALNLVPGLAQTVHEKVVEFGDAKPLALRMNNDLKK